MRVGFKQLQMHLSWWSNQLHIVNISANHMQCYLSQNRFLRRHRGSHSRCCTARGQTGQQHDPKITHPVKKLPSSHPVSARPDSLMKTENETTGSYFVVEQMHRRPPVPLGGGGRWPLNKSRGGDLISDEPLFFK